MRRSIVAAVLTAAICVPVASAHPLSKGGWTLYERCWKALGADCGRNVAEDGFRHSDGKVTDPTRPQLHEWRDHIRYAMNPPEPTVIDTYQASAPPAPVATSVPATSGSCPASMAGEASSPTAVNPTSGASGCYQVLPSTAAAMGPACADVNAQSCVDAICASQGNSAWSASGATPCG